MKAKRKYFYLDDFEHRLLVGCLMTARNEYIHEDKPIEDVNDLILKIIDAPSKKLRVIVKEESVMDKYITDERTGLKCELVGDY